MPCLRVCDAQLKFESDEVESRDVPIEFALRPKNDRHVAINTGYHVAIEDTMSTSPRVPCRCAYDWPNQVRAALTSREALCRNPVRMHATASAEFFKLSRRRRLCSGHKKAKSSKSKQSTKSKANKGHRNSFAAKSLRSNCCFRVCLAHRTHSTFAPPPTLLSAPNHYPRRRCLRHCPHNTQHSP